MVGSSGRVRLPETAAAVYRTPRPKEFLWDFLCVLLRAISAQRRPAWRAAELRLAVHYISKRFARTRTERSITTKVCASSSLDEKYREKP